MTINEIHNLDGLLEQAEAMTTTNSTEPVDTSEPLSQEEQEELRDFVLGSFAQQIGIDYAQEGEESKEVIEEHDEEEVSSSELKIPEIEQPVEVPDYTQVRAETTRFSDATWFKKVQEQNIILAGVGGIGSNMAIILAKLNPASIYIFDDDIVESYNIAGQFYSKEDVGTFKVDALCANIVNFTNYSAIYACNRRYTESEGLVGNIMICGFDNMSARKIFYNKWKEHVMSLPEEERTKCLFIDGRLTAEEMQILCITGTDTYYMEQYEQRFLFEEYMATELPCSYKQTGFMAQMIGSLMVNLLVNFCANLASPVPVMSLPFFTTYNSNIMYLNMER